jgi:hypothetical protein
MELFVNTPKTILANGTLFCQKSNIMSGMVVGQFEIFPYSKTNYPLKP